MRITWQCKMILSRRGISCEGVVALVLQSVHLCFRAVPPIPVAPACHGPYSDGTAGSCLSWPYSDGTADLRCFGVTKF